MVHANINDPVDDIKLDILEILWLKFLPPLLSFFIVEILPIVEINHHF